MFKLDNMRSYIRRMSISTDKSVTLFCSHGSHMQRLGVRMDSCTWLSKQGDDAAKSLQPKSPSLSSHFIKPEIIDAIRNCYACCILSEIS